MLDEDFDQLKLAVDVEAIELGTAKRSKEHVGEVDGACDLVSDLGDWIGRDGGTVKPKSGTSGHGRLLSEVCA
jgi:hypothetical protein